jgi:hypothetical protein
MASTNRVCQLRWANKKAPKTGVFEAFVLRECRWVSRHVYKLLIPMSEAQPPQVVQPAPVAMGAACTGADSMTAPSL